MTVETPTNGVTGFNATPPFSVKLPEYNKAAHFLPSALQGEAVVYEFSKDKALLHQYYELRHKMYTNMWNLEHFEGGEDFYDSCSEILIARLGKLCVGGARITVKKPDIRLPMEGDDFNLEALLPEYDLKHNTYAECSRLAMLPQFRDGDNITDMYATLNAKGVSMGVRYAFAIAPISQARGYCMMHHRMGIHTYKLLKHVAVPDRPEFEGIRMCLSMLDLTAFLPEQRPVAYQDAFEIQLPQ